MACHGAAEGGSRREQPLGIYMKGASEMDLHVASEGCWVSATKTRGDGWAGEGGGGRVSGEGETSMARCLTARG